MKLCLLLRVLLDDPARGPHAFWKTRPPSGAAVFAAKAIIILFVSLAVPLIADAVFIALAGPSGGGAERLTLYLVPPALAFMAGAASVTWKRVLIWLPVAVIVIVAAAILLVVTAGAGFIKDTGDIRVVTAALLLAALRCWHRRGKPIALPGLTSLLPPLAAYGAACTGWHPGRSSLPPPGAHAERITVEWHSTLKPKLAGGRSRKNERQSLMLPLSLKRLPDDRTVFSVLRSVNIAVSGHSTFSAPCERALPAKYQGQRIFDESDPGISVQLSADQAALLSGRAFDVSGAMRIHFYDRKPQSIPLNGTHTLREGGCQWKITPFADFSLFNPWNETSGARW